MPIEDYSGKEKTSLLNIRELWQYLTGGGAQALRKAMGLGDTLGALPIANGGTGATNKDGAWKNISPDHWFFSGKKKVTGAIRKTGLYLVSISYLNTSGQFACYYKGNVIARTAVGYSVQNDQTIIKLSAGDTICYSSENGIANKYDLAFGTASVVSKAAIVALSYD